MSKTTKSRKPISNFRNITTYTDLREDKRLTKFFSEIKKYNPLTIEEEKKYLELAQNGDRQAEHKLILHNLKFVISIAKNYSSVTPYMHDIIMAGTMGLIKSIQRFDLNTSTKLITYSVFWIRQSIMDYLNKNGKTIRIPDNLSKDIQSSNKTPLTEGYLNESLEFDSYFNYIHIDNDSEEMNSIRDRYLATSEEFMADYELTLKEKTGVEHKINVIIDKHLNERESTIIKKYYGFEDGISWKLEDISELIGIHKERVRQIKENAIRKIRANLYK